MRPKSRKPSIFINTPLNRKEVKGRVEWVNSYVRSYPSYEELKKSIPELLRLSSDDQVHVYRHRRGQWGEWFEIWEEKGGKPVIVKEGWM